MRTRNYGFALIGAALYCVFVSDRRVSGARARDCVRVWWFVAVELTNPNDVDLDAEVAYTRIRFDFFQV